MMRFTFALIIFLSLSTIIRAQYYSSGADPSNIKWRQLNSEVFKVVYPEEIESEAKRFIAMLDSLYAYGGHSLNHTPKPIKVLMHSHTAYSNGFVSWAPKRMEIYTTPHQGMFAQDWLEQLAIHEFRHVVQIDKLNQGFTKVLTYPFGQQAIGAVLGLYAPLWFLEGDATLTETTLSQSGRGRQPSFEQEIKAQVIEKTIYNYDKAYFGSYKDYVPNHYNMGYLFTAGARYQYGADVWEKALDESARKPWSVTPFNRGIKNVTGKNKVPLYNEVFEDWKKRWESINDELTDSQYDIITKRDTRYKNYLYPTVIDNDYLIVEINGPGELNHFAKINTKTGEEERLLNTGSRNREPFSYANNIIVWTELERHPRWENQHFSVIRTLDLTTGKQRKITTQSRYKAPALSPDGQSIIVTNTSLSNTFSLHLLDTKDSSIKKEIAIPDNAYPMTPSWDENGQLLTLILLTKEGKKIVTLSLEDEEWTDVTEASYTEIRFPKIKGDYIYYTGSYSGIENLYRISINGGQLEKVSEANFGAAYSTFSDTQLFFQNYTSDGYLIAATDLSQIESKPYVFKEPAFEPYIQKLQEDEKGIPQLKNVSTDAYQSKKYSKWNLFNFHSWAPAFVNLDDAGINTGASIMSQNLLSTTFITAGFNADQQYSREKYNFNISYQAWWPVLDLSVKAGNQKHKTDGYFISEKDTFHVFMDAKPNHMLVEFDMNLPLNLTRGKYSRKIQPAVGFSYQQSDSYSYEQTFISVVDNQIIEKEKVTHTVEGIDIKSADYSLFAYNLLRTTQRDVSTRFGQVVNLSYRHTPFGGWDYGSIIGAHTRLYFPGIGRHHSIRIDNDWHKKEKGEVYNNSGEYNSFFSFSDYVSFPRGINTVSNDELYSFKADYMLPLLNPDFNIPGVLYLKRITANLFYDYSQASLRLQEVASGQWIKTTKDFSSIGTEIRGEFHPFRFVFPVSMGYRYAYLPNTKEHYHEVLFSMGIAGIVTGKK